jgi:hypothetical protein
MTITVGGTAITFNDGTTQSTAAGAVTTTAVLNATAGASVGAVGTYAMCIGVANTSNPLTPGSTVAGSNLRYSSANASLVSTVPSGTWRTMGNTPVQFGAGNVDSVTVFLRIS